VSPTVVGMADFSDYEEQQALASASDISGAPTLHAFREPTEGLSLRENFSWTLLGNVVYAGCQWGMIIVLARLGSPEMVGKFALGLAITAPILMFSSLQLRAIQATDANQDYRFGHYFALRILCSGLGLVVILCISWGTGYRGDTAMVILLIGVAKVLESLSDIIYGLLQYHHRMDIIAKSMILKGIASVAGLAGGVAVTGRVTGGTLFMAIAWGAVLFFYDVYYAARFAKSYESYCPGNQALRLLLTETVESGKNISKLLVLAWLALPLGLVMMLISLNSNISRYYVEHYSGQRDLGIFAALSYLMVIGTVIINALGSAASPRLARMYAAGFQKPFFGLLSKMLCIGAILGGLGTAVAIFAGRELLTLIYGSEYADRIDVFVWLMVAAFVGYLASSLGYALTAARKFSQQVPIFAVVTVASIAGCMLLVPGQGMLGAAQAVLMASLVQLAASTICLLRTRQTLLPVAGLRTGLRKDTHDGSG
jgi:O-antigen/teichoic acid export membrane protein